MILFFVAFIFAFAVLSEITGNATLAFFLIILGIVIFLISSLESKKAKKEKEEADRLKRDAEQKAFFDNYSCPYNCKQFIYVNGHPCISDKKILYVWKDNEFLNILIEYNDARKYKIPIIDIKYFSIKGDLRQETEFIGDSNGLTTGETIIAEGLLGTAATMKRNQQPLSKIKNIDERRTIINATIDEIDCFIFFEKGDLYNYLLDQLPEKEQSFVQMNKID